ncbi:MAG: DUF4363 family protein [Oscillospiraceae bacterium]|nr:DUF4363 family protein [Oscillospiraceae bacterium]MBQ2791986.1 DUF4363 family protein [Oscillospiraceae bacterium]
MKRLFLCGTILLLILISCFAGFLTVTRCSEEFDRQLSQLQEEAYTLSFQQLADRSAQVALRWESAEQAMVRYLRRNCLDEVTGSMAKLEKLAQYGDLSQFCAEVDRIRTLLAHVCDGEIPSWRNIF